MIQNVFKHVKYIGESRDVYKLHDVTVPTDDRRRALRKKHVAQISDRPRPKDIFMSIRKFELEFNLLINDFCARVLFLHTY